MIHKFNKGCKNTHYDLRHTCHKLTISTELSCRSITVADYAHYCCSFRYIELVFRLGQHNPHRDLLLLRVMSDLNTETLFRVDGLVALVTGGGTGIGLMITKALALNGAHRVYISGRRKEVLEDAAKQSPHGNIIPIQADLSKKEGIEAMAEHIRKDIGYLNLIVANAGAGGPQVQQDASTTLKEVQERAMATSMEEWDSCFRINVYGAYYSIMAVLDLLDEGNKRKNYCNGEVKSQVIVTGSIGGYSRLLGAGNAYRATKAAITHIAKCLTTSFQNFAIRVNTIAPGLFPSELAVPLIDKYSEQSKQGKLPRSLIPEERVGCEQDMAGTLLYLASRAGAYNNGNVIVLDGGRLGVMPATY